MTAMHSDDEDTTPCGDVTVPPAEDTTNVKAKVDGIVKMEGDVDSSDDVIESAGGCDGQVSWHCHECDIKFSSIGNFKAHKDFYCGKNRRRAPAGDAGSRTSPRQRASSAVGGSMRPGFISQQMLSSLLPLASQGMFVPMLVPTPYGVTYAMLPIPAFPGAPAAADVRPEAPAVSQAKPKVKEEKNEQQPLDLSLKKEATKVDDDIEIDAPRSKVRRSSPEMEPGEIVRPVVNDAPLPGSLPSLALQAQILKEMMLRQTKAPSDVNRCDDCNIVFYKHENYKVHKEMYCAGRRSSEMAGSETMTSQQSPRRTTQSATSPGKSARAPAEQRRDSVTSADEFTMQYFCVPCNIRFSNPDTLEAHQQYYCPARKVMAEQLALSATAAGSQSPPRQQQQQPQRSPLAASPRNRLDDVVCTKCSKSFASSDELLHHGCTHTTMKIPVFCCPYCSYVAQSDSRLLDHIKAHAPTKAYRCELCGYRGNTVRGMRMHGKTHIDAGEVFTDEHMTEYHEPPLIPKRLRTVTENVEVNVTSDLLHASVGNIHRRKRTRSSGGGYTKQGSAIDHMINKTMQNACVICHMMFDDYDALRKHMNLHVVDELNFRKQLDSKSTSTDSKKSTNYNIDTILGTPTKANSADLKCDVTTCKSEGPDCADPESSSEIEIDRHGTPHSPTSDAPPTHEVVTSPDAETTTPDDDSANRREQVNYCKQCDISFVYLATYIAHKKHYCSSHAGERSAVGSTELKV